MDEWNRKCYQEMFYARQNRKEDADSHESGKYISVFTKNGYLEMDTGRTDNCGKWSENSMERKKNQ